MKHNCNKCNQVDPCGCSQPNFIGCKDKVEFTCLTYTGEDLLPLNIKKGDNGDVVVKKINNHIHNFEESIQIDPTHIESIGGKIDIYKGLSSALIHEIKSIQGEPNKGIIVENIIAEPISCEGGSDYINVKIDESWLRNWLLDNICEIISEAGCGTIPPSNNPVTTNIVKSIVNRGYVDIQGDFATHFTDADGHQLTSITIVGQVNGFTLNGNPITSGQELNITDLNTGILRYTGDNVDTAYIKTVSYIAKDSSGSFSNTSQIIINVAAKQFLVFSTPTVSLLREFDNVKTSTINYSNANGQTISNGHILMNQGIVGQPGYLKITVTSNVTLTSSGSIPIQIESHPTSTQANQTVSYVFDGSTGNINLTYNSIPENSDIVKNTAYNTSFNFTTLDFVNNYTDFDGDNLVEIMATGNMSGYEYDLNGTNNYQPYTSGTWIPINNVTRLRYVPLNQITAYTKTNPWFAKDSQGNISE